MALWATRPLYTSGPQIVGGLRLEYTSGHFYPVTQYSVFLQTSGTDRQLCPPCWMFNREILQEVREFSLLAQYRNQPSMALAYPDGEVLWIPPVDIKVKKCVDKDKDKYKVKVTC